jgi:Protein of unknown function (DUF3570)
MMSSRKPFVLATLLYPGLQVQGEIPHQQYDYSYQLYQEDDDRIRVESHYIRGQIEINDATSVRFQWLNDAISGASPTGAMPDGVQPFLSDVEDVRTGILGAISRQFGDHRVELEISHSKENDYLSRGYALSDTLELNQKNTTISYGANYLDDVVTVPILGKRDKHGYDLFSGISQIIDKNTVVSANLTLGYNDGYLNDPYKVVQRTDSTQVPDGSGGTIDIPVVNLYRENRPDSRFRQVLQFEGKHYFTAPDGALDAVVRFSHDDYGVLSETLQLEWRQNVRDHLQIVPFFRYFHQSAANFFAQTIDNLPIGTPSSDPDGSGPNYSADYRLSSFDATSGGVRLRYQFNDTITASAAYERYVMSGSGSSSSRAPAQAYPSAAIWTLGLSATF